MELLAVDDETSGSEEDGRGSPRRCSGTFQQRSLRWRKARICKTLKWTEFPEGGDYRSFKVHDLTVLLHLSGKESVVKRTSAAEWGIASTWTPEIRYKMTGKATQNEAKDMIEAVKTLMGVLR